MNKNKLGLVFGIFLALIHAVWALAVGINLGQTFMDFIFPLHFLNSLYTIAVFSWTNAIMLTLMAFVAGYAMGWVVAGIWNLLNKK